MTPLTLICGGSAAQREATLAIELQRLPDADSVGVILEGIPASASVALAAHRLHTLIRLAPGCPCCMGNLAMRVSLNRLLRRPPRHLFIVLARADHLTQVQAFLHAPPYDAHLTMTNPPIQLPESGLP